MFPFSPYEALVERLSDGIIASRQRVTFILGAAISAPTSKGGAGVCGTSEIVTMIEERYFSDRKSEFREYISKYENKYSAAFDYLIPRRGQNAANSVIKAAVWNAHIAKSMLGLEQKYQLDEKTEDHAFSSFEADNDSWYLTPALTGAGELISDYSEIFGQTVLTTNFDPLIEVAIRRSGGLCYRNTLHRDGGLGQSSGDGTNIVHLHGYWWGSDTLHTPRQLTQDRPRLKSSISSLLRNDVILVCGYGGWDDVINSALSDLVHDDTAKPEILWAVHEADAVAAPSMISPMVDRGRATIYANVDCNQLFPDVLARLREIEPKPSRQKAASTSFAPSALVQAEYQDLTVHLPQSRASGLLGENEDDRPPNTDVYVGREEQMEALNRKDYAIAYLTGIAGQGKSALAAAFLRSHLDIADFEYCVWRDCKEEAERFEGQLVRLIVGLSGRKVTSSELGSLAVDQLILLFFRYLGNRRIMFVFDNVDHHVDMEQRQLSGSPALLIEAAQRERTNSIFIFTCRSNLIADRDSILNIRLTGLDVRSAITLFQRRKANVSDDQVRHAHSVTAGHAFWLDLLAAQVSKRPEISLEQMLHAPSPKDGGMPVETLQSIWQTLREREHLVLRTLAECVRPTNEIELASFLDGQLNYNRISKALVYLRGLNLIVTKSSRQYRDEIELHPLIREFIRRTFAKSDRKTFIDVIISYYERMFLVRVGKESPKLTVEEMQKWVEGIELNIAAGKIEAAFQLAYKVGESGLLLLNTMEYVRVCTLLYYELDWSKASSVEYFDSVTSNYVETLADMDRIHEAHRLLARYRETIVGKTARYINYCDMNVYLEWTNGEYQEAIRWGEEGERLKSDGNTDTKFDTSHNLALARRDSGDVGAALSYFLKGRKIEDVLDIEELDEARDGSYYGNVGRCLQLMGQVDTALICYRKSALLIERNEAGSALKNKGYARQWIGELLAAKEDVINAAKFLKAALRIWSMISPLRETRLMSSISSRPDIAIELSDLDESKAERYCRAWIFGRESDFTE